MTDKTFKIIYLCFFLGKEKARLKRAFIFVYQTRIEITSFCVGLVGSIILLIL